jgi:lipopolysaccharide transport system permease protein
VTEQEIVHHYSAEADRGGIWRHARAVTAYPMVAWHHRGLVWNFARRELLGRFRGSLLGVFWVMVQPLFLFAIYYLVFGYLFGGGRASGELGSGAPSAEFALYLFSGVTMLLAFNEGTSRACTVVVDNGNLVKKVAFPSELLPLHPILVALAVYVVATLMMIVGGLALGGLQLDAMFAFWPLVLAIQFLLTLGVGLVLAQLYVFSRDLSHLWGIAAQTLMFVTPVFWQRSLIESTPGNVEGPMVLFLWNPLYSMLAAQRQVLGLGATVHEPFAQNVTIAAAWALFFLAVGFGMFTSRRHKFADLV